MLHFVNDFSAICQGEIKRAQNRCKFATVQAAAGGAGGKIPVTGIFTVMQDRTAVREDWLTVSALIELLTVPGKPVQI